MFSLNVFLYVGVTKLLYLGSGNQYLVGVFVLKHYGLKYCFGPGRLHFGSYELSISYDVNCRHTLKPITMVFR